MQCVYPFYQRHLSSSLNLTLFFRIVNRFARWFPIVVQHVLLPIIREIYTKLKKNIYQKSLHTSHALISTAHRCGKGRKKIARLKKEERERESPCVNPRQILLLSRPASLFWLRSTPSVYIYIDILWMIFSSARACVLRKREKVEDYICSLTSPLASFKNKCVWRRESYNIHSPVYSTQCAWDCSGRKKRARAWEKTRYIYNSDCFRRLLPFDALSGDLSCEV